MNLTRTAVLQLNRHYEPTRITTARHALKLVTLGKAEVVIATDVEIYPSIHLPSVIRILTFKYVPIRLQKVSRRNIFTRDGFRCMYCGADGKRGGLELEHIIPRSRGGKSSWDNLVASCRRCNQRKNDRTPEEAGMRLIRRPLPQSIHTPRFLLRTMGSEVKSWGPYLYQNSAGDSRFSAVGQ